MNEFFQMQYTLLWLIKPVATFNIWANNPDYSA